MEVENTNKPGITVHQQNVVQKHFVIGCGGKGWVIIPIINSSITRG